MSRPHTLAASLLTAVFVAVAPATTALARQAPPTWTELGGSATGGGISDTQPPSMYPRLTTGPDSFPVVVWQENAPMGWFIYLRRWNGTSWIELGGSASGYGIAGSVGSYATPGPVAVDSSGNVYVVYMKYVDNQVRKSFMVRWNGQSWGELGGSGSGFGLSTTQGHSECSSIVIDADGNPWVAWTQLVSSRDEIYLSRWDGSKWVEVGGSASGGGISNTPEVQSWQPRLALDPSGQPIVAWSEKVSGPSVMEIYVRRWSGTAWEEMGGSATGGGVSNLGAGASMPFGLAVDSSGHPVVVYYQVASFPSEIYLRRWNGSAWAELGGSGSGYGVSGPRPSVYPGRELTTGGFGVGLDPEGKPVVAWTEGDTWTPYQVRVRRWTGVSWEGIEGSFDDAGLGASSPGISQVGSMGVAKTGDVFVAWTNGPPGGQEIHLRHWRNARVAELGQFKANGSTPLSLGMMITDSEVVLRGRVSRALVSFPLRLQIEIRPIGTEFTGVPTAQSNLLPSQSLASVTVAGLAPGGWRWRARALESTGFASAWESFGDNPDSHADFWVVAPKDPVPQPSSEGGGSGSKGCGLLGMEAPLLVISLAWLMRRRRAHRIGGSCSPSTRSSRPWIGAGRSN